MIEIHDLSGTIEEGMWDYRVLPGLEDLLPVIRLSPAAEVKKDGFFSSQFTLSTLSGTYLESGSHIIENGRDLDSYTLQDFIKPAKIVRIPGVEKNESVSRKQLAENASEIAKGDALFIDTGWHRNWNAPGYVLDCPNFSSEAMEWVLEQEPSIFGVDVPCIEAAWSEDDEEERGSMLLKLFASGSLLVAPLVNLDSVQSTSGTVFCIPLKLKGTSGAPARIFFIEGSLTGLSL